MGTGNLTQNRTASSGYTNAFLNSVYEQLMIQIGILPNGLISNNGNLVNTDLDESDVWSAGIETPDDIAQLVAYLGMTYNIIQPDEDTGSGFSTDSSWIATWVYDLIQNQDGSIDITKNTVLDIYDYLENQYASGAGLSLVELGSTIPPRQNAQQWVDQSIRLGELVKDIAMNYGNQYVQGGAVYNTSRIGESITLNQAITNANNYSSVARSQQVATGATSNLAVTSKFLPFQQQQNYQLTSGGGNSQNIPALNGGGASPFRALRGFSPSFQSSVSVQNSSVQQLSHQGNQQQFSFNEDSSKTPVYMLNNGFDEREKLGSFRFKFSLNAGLTITQNEWTPNDTAIGGFSGTFYALEDFQTQWDDVYINNQTIATENFSEFSKDYSNRNAWGSADPFSISFESFSSGFGEGTRPATDKPDNCGGGSNGVGSQVFNEDLSAQVNGSNTAFTVSKLYVAGSLRAYRNGQRMSEAQVTETGSSTFSTTELLSSGEVLYIDYVLLST